MHLDGVPCFPNLFHCTAQTFELLHCLLDCCRFTKPDSVAVPSAGLTDQGITVATTESVEQVRGYTRTNTLVHAEVSYILGFLGVHTDAAS